MSGEAYRLACEKCEDIDRAVLQQDIHAIDDNLAGFALGIGYLVAGGAVDLDAVPLGLRCIVEDLGVLAKRRDELNLAIIELESQQSQHREVKP